MTASALCGVSALFRLYGQFKMGRACWPVARLSGFHSAQTDMRLVEIRSRPEAET